MFSVFIYNAEHEIPLFFGFDQIHHEYFKNFALGATRIMVKSKKQCNFMFSIINKN